MQQKIGVRSFCAREGRFICKFICIKDENITLTDFILKEKVKLARNLLSYSPYSYIEIATYLGFSSQSHLGKVFKKYTGMTMRQYREKYERNFG